MWQIYFPELLAPLLRSLLHLTSLLPRELTPSLIISYKIRSLVKESSFWSAFGLWFHFWPVLIRDKSNDGEWRRFGSDLDDTTFLFVAHRRAESFDWEIPALDDELLGGVGAHGHGNSVILCLCLVRVVVDGQRQVAGVEGWGAYLVCTPLHELPSISWHTPCTALLFDSHPIIHPMNRGSQQWERVAWAAYSVPFRG